MRHDWQFLNDRSLFRGGIVIERELWGMRIFIRANEIFVANISDILERSENPVRIVQLIVAEMEEAILDAHKASSRMGSERNALRRQIARLDEQQASWSDKAKLAMSKDRLDLAKGALTEREKAADLAAKCQRDVAALDREIAENDANLVTLNGKLDEARARQKALLAAGGARQGRAADRGSAATSGAQAALNRFEVLEQRVAFAEARAQSGDADYEARTLERELGALDLAARVDASLAALIAKAGGAKKAAGKRAAG